MLFVMASRRPAPRNRSGSGVRSRSTTVRLANTARVNGQPESRGRCWVLDLPFEHRGVGSAFGARWDPESRSHLVYGDALPAALLPYRSQPFSWERWKEDDLNGVVTGADEPPDPELQIRVHQSEAADRIRAAFEAGRPGFLLADDVGTGKTLSVLEAVRTLPVEMRNVLIMCPKSVIPHWRRSITLFGVEDRRICVINYDRLKSLLSVPESAAKAKRARTRNKRIADQGASLVDWDLVVIDESHKAKDPVSQRSRAAATLAKNSFRIWMSATAGTNPLDLSYLAPLLAAVTSEPVKNLAEYEAWCLGRGIKISRGDFGKWQWEPNDEDLETMRSLLYDGALPAGMRRRPEELAGWPEVVRALTPVALGVDEARQYQESWTQFRRERHLEPKGRDSKGLGAITRFRQKASLLRIEGTIDFVMDLLDNGHQVAVSVVWLESLEALANGLDAKGIPVSVIHGSMSGEDRESERIAFQRGQTRVCVFTPVDGISLHAGDAMVQGNTVPRSLVVHDLRWSAFESLQVEGRCHRDGQAARVFLTFADGTIERRVAEVLLRRVMSMKTMSGDDLETLREIEAELMAA